MINIICTYVHTSMVNLLSSKMLLRLLICQNLGIVFVVRFYIDTLQTVCDLFHKILDYYANRSALFGEEAKGIMK